MVVGVIVGVGVFVGVTVGVGVGQTESKIWTTKVLSTDGTYTKQVP